MGGFMGMNGYSGSLANSMNAAMGTPEGRGAFGGNAISNEDEGRNAVPNTSDAVAVPSFAGGFISAPEPLAAPNSLTAGISAPAAPSGGYGVGSSPGPDDGPTGASSASSGGGPGGSGPGGSGNASDSPAAGQAGGPGAGESSNGAGTGGGGGSSKIVCTAMNRAYGFGQFRNRVWLVWARDRAPEYQLGYHAIFLPLVLYGFGGRTKPRRMVRAVLEHIARHRTADIWQQRRGRRDNLGAVYRAFLEPICYAVGWVIKRLR